jgi:hypothetical protein
MASAESVPRVQDMRSLYTLSHHNLDPGCAAITYGPSYARYLRQAVCRIANTQPAHDAVRVESSALLNHSCVCQ